MPASAAGPSSGLMQHIQDRVQLTGRQVSDVSTAIQASWQRAVAAGLVPDQVHAPFDPDVDADGRLRWAAAPTMTAVSLDLPDLEAALILTDRRGQILARWTATAAAADLMDDIGGAPGYVCSEAAVGTNSIGLALASRAPAVVRGFEHYADRLTGFAGISRAVIHPVTAQLLGTVALVCPDRHYSPAMRALIGRIAHETRQRLAPDALGRDATLREAFLSARRRAKGPMAAVDAHTLLVNSAASRKPMIWLPPSTRPLDGFRGSVVRSCSLVSHWTATEPPRMRRKNGVGSGSRRCGHTVAPSPDPSVCTIWNGCTRSGRRDRAGRQRPHRLPRRRRRPPRRGRIAARAGDRR